MSEQQTAHDKQWSLVIAKAWADEDFKARLTADPAAVLREHGVEMTPGVEIKVVENTDKVQHFVIPANPTGDLSEEELSPVAGADSFSGGCLRCGRCGCGCGGCGRCGRCDAF